MGTEIKNVFVSHYHEYEDSIKNLKRLLGAKYDLRNYSVTSEKFNNAKSDDYIKSLLRPLIKQAGTFICLIGPNTHDSDWVDWEVREAARLNKPIIGIFLRGASNADLPDAVYELADTIVGWNEDRIVDAIKNGQTYFEKADGSPRNEIDGNRTTC